MWQSKKLNMAEHSIAIYGRGSAIWLTKKFTIAEQVYVAKEVQNSSVKVQYCRAGQCNMWPRKCNIAV